MPTTAVAAINTYVRTGQMFSDPRSRGQQAWAQVLTTTRRPRRAVKAPPTLQTRLLDLYA